jgi:peptidyl-prolyl cis-trans isomerase B (cyclophilin B)
MSKKKRKKTQGKVPAGRSGRGKSQSRKVTGRKAKVFDRRSGAPKQPARPGLMIALAVAGVLLLVVGGILLYQQGQARKQAELDALRQAELEAAQREAEREARLGVRDIVRIETDKGLIVMELFPELMPNTVANFESLARAGFYDGLTWHRVENWVVQTGDPTGTGSGGSGQTIRLETHEDLPNVRGAVGMARTDDPHSATSQFYILKADARSLDNAYAIFGRVVEGMDVVDSLKVGDKMTKVTVEPGSEGR